MTESLQRVDEGLGLANTNLNRAADLVKAFKRMAIDRASEDIVEFHLDELVKDLFITLKPKFKTTRLSIQQKIDPGIVFISRPGTLSQVLQNLLINAINHGFSARQTGQITLTAEQLEDEIRIEVADTGVGIADPIKATLFEPFVTTGRGNGNTGLGLYFVHQWVHKILQGHIEVVSEAGKGSRFILLLPQSLSPPDTE